MNKTTYDGNGNVVEQVIDHGDGTGTLTTFNESGDQLNSTTIDMPEQAQSPAVDTAELANKAREAVSGMASTNNTRKAIEALADAIEAAQL